MLFYESVCPSLCHQLSQFVNNFLFVLDIYIYIYIYISLPSVSFDISPEMSSASFLRVGKNKPNPQNTPKMEFLDSFIVLPV